MIDSKRICNGIVDCPFNNDENGALGRCAAVRDSRDCCKELSVEMEQKMRNQTSRHLSMKIDYLTCQWSNETHLKHGYNCGDIYFFQSTSVIGITAWYMTSYLPRKHSLGFH